MMSSTYLTPFIYYKEIIQKFLPFDLTRFCILFEAPASATYSMKAMLYVHTSTVL